jgi:hypothetical protein
VFTTPSEENIDTSFLTGESCTTPCWHGLVVNKSTKEDVISTLNSLPFVEHNNYRELTTTWIDNKPATHIQFYCASDHTTECGWAILSDNTLRGIWTVLEYDLTLKDAVNRLGSPEYIEYQWPSMSGKCSISVLWNTHGTVAEIYDDSSYNECESIIDGNKISPNIVIDSIGYFSFEGLNSLGDCCKRINWTGFKDE